MEDVTVELPDDLAEWLQDRAAKGNRSVSEWVAERLAEMQRQEGDAPEEDRYEAAMKSYLARKPRKINWLDGRKPTREELHDRAGLR